MNIKISGYVFATIEQVKKVVDVDLRNDDFSIKHEDLFTVVTVNQEETYFENEILIIKPNNLEEEKGMKSIDEILEMTNEEVVEVFTDLVKSEMMKQYSLSMEEVEKALNDSTYTELMKTDPKFVLHYDVQYWVDHAAEIGGLK